MGGCLASRTFSATRTVLLKRGPMGTQSTSISMLSITMTLSGLLYASRNVLSSCCTFCISLKPTMSSGDTSLMNGKPESMAILAAMAVLPLPGGPCSATERMGVESGFLTWLM